MPMAAQAQNEAAEQLPPEAAQQQIPSSFPSVTGDGAPASSQTSANPIDQIGAESASPGSIPAQPEERRLVPSTPMGIEAQNAASGQGGQAPVGENTSVDDMGATAAPGADNPVEQSAAEAQRSFEEQPDIEAPASTADILERYTQKAEQAQASREDENTAAATRGDDLPPSNRLNMVKIEGVGFDNSGNPRVSVGIDDVSVPGKTSEELQEEIRTEAFDAALTGMFPLSPEQIEGLLKRYDRTQEAAQKPVYEAPRPEVSVFNVSLDPGVMPSTIKTAVGNVTTINVLDATGAPWPVQDVTWAGDYEVVEPEEGGHIIRITPMSHFARGNIVIRLLTLKTPLTMSLETGREVVQYRVDARIPEYGPFAQAPIMQGGKSLVAGSPDLTAILDGAIPGNAIKLQVGGVDGRTTAYAMGGTTFVRTPLTLLSPAWQSSVSSADGMNVYALSNAPVLLLSDGGEFQRATLSEKEDLLDE